MSHSNSSHPNGQIDSSSVLAGAHQELNNPVDESDISRFLACACESDSERSTGCKGLSDCSYLGAEPSSPQPDYNVEKRLHKFDPRKHLTEIYGIEVYASTVVTHRHSTISRQYEHQRGEIFNLSPESLARLAFIAFNTPASFPSMLTLTYPAEFSNNGNQVKGDLDNFLRWYRRHFPDALYLWWLEFQRRGAPHFHVLSTVDLSKYGKLAHINRRKGNKSETWQTHWDTWKTQEAAWKKLGGWHTAWEVINDAEGGKKYAAKYATKAYQKAVPPAYRDVGRFWGHSQDGVKPDPAGVYECSEPQLREALSQGGWEYLPDDAGMIYRELYQAAKAIDLNSLTQVETLDRPTPKPARPILLTELSRPLGPSAYVCEKCGGVSGKWLGQCPACGKWSALILQEG